jgi:hypothetical protein
MAKGRSRYRSRIAAVSIASFLALLGYEAGRMHQGDDPALAKTKATSSTSSQTTQRTQTTQTTQDQKSSATQDGGGYYTPPASDPPTTGSS